MLTEEELRECFGGMALIPHELTQFDIENSYRRWRYKSSSRGVSLGEYTRVDTDGETVFVKIRGSLNLYEGYEVPLSGGASPVAWKVGDAVTSVTLTREDLTLRGEGLSIHISPNVHLGGSGNFRGDVLPLNAMAALIAFSNVNECVIYFLIDLVSGRGEGKASYLYSSEEWRSLFPGRDEAEFWSWDLTLGYPNAKDTRHLEETNGWILSLPS